MPLGWRPRRQIDTSEAQVVSEEPVGGGSDELSPEEPERQTTERNEGPPKEVRRSNRKRSHRQLYENDDLSSDLDERVLVPVRTTDAFEEARHPGTAWGIETIDWKMLEGYLAPRERNYYTT